LQYPWIVTSVVVAMTAVLLMVAYVGEAIREAFDPKQFTYYE
jgi:microcin C transport system permease protein